MTHVAILWHMHQPYYKDPVTREHILPWVRLHALKDYYGMVALLREFPNVKVTFNLVPSLLVQLEEFAADRARDRFLDVSLKPAADLTEDDAAFAVTNFFHAHRERMINVYPRYAELLTRRGGAPPTVADAHALVRRFDRDDLRDLQVLHKLAWIDPIYLENDARVRSLVSKGRQYSEDDKVVLRQVELELLNKVIPEYRDAAERGQIELSTSPFYHPILPLLCDTDIYLRTHPDSRMPRHRFMHPEDAREQLLRAVACHERLFHHKPVGVWPSEGSVSNAMVPLVAEAGFQWMATDELVLARTLDATFTRGADGHLLQPERLYKPYAVRTDGARVACAFRDHALSDRIGFVYAGWAPDVAAADLVWRLVEAGRRYADRTGGGEAFIPLILDGENAWEYYEGGGRPFLRALYAGLSAHPELRAVTMADGCRRAETDLPGVFPGSWIDANFYIWFGHPDDQRAWDQLADARQALEEPGTAPATAVAEAREEIMVAEGSDWCWWYGDDHSSAHDLEFDDLYRRHLRNVYGVLQKAVPDELFVSNISTRALAPAESAPIAFITPTVDGEETSYFEWLGAGTFEPRAAAGAMHQIARRTDLLTLVQFGFDHARFYVRIDAARRLVDLLAEGYEFSLKFLQPDGVRFSVRQTLGRMTGLFWDRRVTDPGPLWVERGPGGASVAAGAVLEVGVALNDLGVGVGDSVAFFVAIYDRDSNELERHPAHRPITVEVPSPTFEALNWSV
jgi:alpha-amylase/alpha-mannosidase (GH57 family)